MIETHSPQRNPKGLMVLIGSVLLMTVLGSMHAFSVFLLPLEQTFGVPRSDASLTYSLALVSVTVLVLAGHHVYRRLSPTLLVLMVAVLGAVGPVLAGQAGNIETVWLGYGVLFGAANGIGYGFCLQFAAQANPAMRGGAMGIVTAAYGLGSALAPVPLAVLIESDGLAGGMTGLAVAVVVVSLPVALMFARSGCHLETDTGLKSATTQPAGRDIVRMWFAYGTAVAAGLMAIGHATGIAAAAGVSDDWIVIAPVAVAVANVGGSVVGGYLVDRLGPRRLLQSMAVLSAVALAIMSQFPVSALTLAGLAAVGFAYGATIAAFPAAIAAVYGPVAAIRAYGKVFTSWGSAGLAAPWFAGYLFEQSGAYGSALLMAACLSVAALIFLIRFPARSA